MWLIDKIRSFFKHGRPKEVIVIIYDQKRAKQYVFRGEVIGPWRRRSKVQVRLKEQVLSVPNLTEERMLELLSKNHRTATEQSELDAILDSTSEDVIIAR